MSDLIVYVPAPDSAVASMVMRGSAIVGTPLDDADYVTIDFEGNRYKTAYFEEFGKRLLHAAGRHVARYPTVARLVAECDQLVRVGTYDYDRERLSVEDDDALLDWIGPAWSRVTEPLEAEEAI